MKTDDNHSFDLPTEVKRSKFRGNAFCFQPQFYDNITKVQHNDTNEELQLCEYREVRKMTYVLFAQVAPCKGSWHWILAQILFYNSANITHVILSVWRPRGRS